jgi:hypothetical protein
MPAPVNAMAYLLSAKSLAARLIKSSIAYSRITAIVAKSRLFGRFILNIFAGNSFFGWLIYYRRNPHTSFPRAALFRTLPVSNLSELKIRTATATITTVKTAA